MKYVTLTCLFAIVSLGAEATAQEATAKKSVSPTGTWRLDYDWEGNLWTDIYQIELGNGGNVTGTLDRNGEKFKIEDGRFKDGQVSFTVTLSGPGDVIAEYKGKVSDSAITGGVVLKIGGQSLDLPWKPSRVIGMADVVGTWHISIDSADGNSYQIPLKITKTGNKFRGVYAPIGVASSVVTNLKVDGGNLLFDVTTDYYGSPIDLTFKGRLDGGKMKGMLKWVLNGDTGKDPFSATHKKEQKSRTASATEPPIRSVNDAR